MFLYGVLHGTYLLILLNAIMFITTLLLCDNEYFINMNPVSCLILCG